MRSQYLPVHGMVETDGYMPGPGGGNLFDISLPGIIGSPGIKGGNFQRFRKKRESEPPGKLLSPQGGEPFLQSDPVLLLRQERLGGFEADQPRTVPAIDSLQRGIDLDKGILGDNAAQAAQGHDRLG